MKTGFLKRLVTEDFKKDQQDLVSKIAYILNPALESITQILTKNINVSDNLNGQLKDIQIQTNADGTVRSGASFTSGVAGNTQAILVVKADNVTDSTKYVDNCPFIN